MTYLKRELQARIDELQRVKVEHRRTLDTNEKLSSEIDNLKATSRLGIPSNRPSVIGDRNASQQTVFFALFKIFLIKTFLDQKRFY